MTMTKEDLIKALVATGMTDDEIYEAIDIERQNQEDLEVARWDLIAAFETYLEALIPDISITQEDEEDIEKSFISMEKDLEIAADLLLQDNLKGTDSLEEVIKAFHKQEETSNPDSPKNKKPTPDADEIINMFIKDFL